MSRKFMLLPVVALAVAGALLAASPVDAQPTPTAHLLLPYFEIDLTEIGVTTLLAVGNISSEEVTATLTVWTNWGIPVLQVEIPIETNSVRTVNLRDWIVFGNLPDEQLTASELAHLQATLSGRPSPSDGLYYSSQVREGLGVGYVTVRGRVEQGRSDVLWGDYFVVNPINNSAEGEALVRLGATNGCPDICQRHAIRFIEGGAFDGGTEIVIWTGKRGVPSHQPQSTTQPQRNGGLTSLFSESGLELGQHELNLVSAQAIRVADLGLIEPFGWLDLSTSSNSFVAVRFTAGGRFSVGLRAFCLPPPIEPPVLTPTSGIRIEKATNGHDADSAPGPTLAVGSAVTWTYVVTNTGDVPLTEVQVVDDQGVAVSCPKTSLEIGESMTCSASGVAVAGQYRNVGTVTGKDPDGQVVQDDDPSHYFGQAPPDNPAIDIEKATNGEDADSAPGPTLAVGSSVTWTYVVTNTGDVTLTNVRVVDDQGVAVSCPKTTLAVGESMTCSASGVAVAGQYRNLGTAIGEDPEGVEVSDQDPSHYFGQGPPENPAIDIEKATNGEDADSAPGPTLAVGSSVTWTYVVTNTGDVELSNVQVTDDQGVAVTCPKSVLAVGESMSCSGHGTAQEGQYRNLGMTEGTSPGGEVVRDEDPSHYFGESTSTGGDEGCTIGYWMNHLSSWGPTGYSPGQTVQSVFSEASRYPSVGPATLLEALMFIGGPDVEAAARLLTKQAVAAVLNASHPDVDYPRTEAQVISETNAALASGNRNTMLTLAEAFDTDNNLGCPLN